MEKIDFLEGISSFIKYLYIQKNILHKNLTPIAKKYKLKMSELNLMLSVRFNKEIQTASDIAKFSELKRGNISLIVETLTCRRFLKQLGVEGDRRMKKLVLTEKAESVLKECEQIMTVIYENSMEGISVEELNGARNVFKKLYENSLKENCGGQEKNEI